LDNRGSSGALPKVTIKPLARFDEAFAWDEGEEDGTRDWWFDAHRRYFARQATREGFEMDDEILAVFERFEVVWPLDGADGINGPTHEQPPPRARAGNGSA